MYYNVQYINKNTKYIQKQTLLIFACKKFSTSAWAGEIVREIRNKRMMPSRFLCQRLTGILPVGGLLVVLLVFVSFSEQALPDTTGLDRKLEGVVENFINRTRVPGVSVLVSKKGEVIFHKSFGMANLEHDIKVTKGTAFPIGSVTKQFTGLAIAQLVVAGKLSLDDRLEKFIPDYPVRGYKITVRNLLNHTSGITNYVHKKGLKEAAWEKHSPEEMLSWFKDEDFVFEPGTRWNYTNSGTYLLGLIIEKASGLSYADYLKENIFKPFGMDRTYVAGSRDVIPTRAAGYNITADGYKNARAYDASVPFSAGAIISTTGDLWKFVNNTHRPDKVSGDIRKIIYKQEILPNGEEAVYTLGCLFASKPEGHRLYSHPGSVWGYSSHLSYYPDDDVAVIILTNSMGYMPGPTSLAQKISRAVMGIKAPEYQNEPMTKTASARLEGTYLFTAQTFVEYDKATVLFKGGMLMFSMGNAKDSLFTLPFTYAGNGQYVMAADDEIILEATAGSEKLLLRYGPVNFNLVKIPNE